MSARRFWNKFKDACFEGDYRGVLEMLDEEQYLLGNLGVEGRLSPGVVDSAFRDACLGNRVDIMILLIERASPRFGMERVAPRSFIITCEWGCMDAVRLLLDRYVDRISADASIIKHSIYACCVRGDAEMASLLLERCGDYSAHMFEISCMEGDLDIVSMLIDSHAALLETAIPNMLAYQCARGDADMVELLLNRCGYMFSQNDYDAAVRAAYLNGHEEVTAILRSGCKDSLVPCLHPKPAKEPTHIFVEYEWVHDDLTLAGDYSLLYNVPYYRAIDNPWAA